MSRARAAIRCASFLALLAIVLRIVLPVLHTHDHGVHEGHPASCDCAAESHAESLPSGQEGIAKAEPPGHHSCLACEIEEGTPFACPPIPHTPITPPWGGERLHLRRDLVTGRGLVGLPRSRAPPAAGARMRIPV